MLNNKINKRSLTDQVYNLIIEQLQTGQLHPGDRLNIEELSRQFDISRTPIREAIGRLQQNGFVETKHNVGTRITALADSRVRTLIEANDILLLGMADIIFDKTDTNLLSETLFKIIEQQREALRKNDNGAFLQSSIAFHEAIIEACPNEFYSSYARDSQVMLDSFVLSYLEWDGKRDASINDHIKIAEAIKGNNRRGYKSAMHAHNSAALIQFEQSK